VQERWEAFEKLYVPAQVPPTTRRAAQITFYRGAYEMLQLVAEVAGNQDLPENAAWEILKGLEEECSSYLESTRKSTVN
jgi:hypothetical protein